MLKKYLFFFQSFLLSLGINQAGAEISHSFWLDGGLSYELPFAPHDSTNQRFDPYPLTPPDRYNNQKLTGNLSAEIGAGYRFKPSGPYQLNVGLYYNYLLPVTLKGQIFPNQSAEPAYNYRYQITSHSLFAGLTLNLINLNSVKPFVEFGVGSAFNSTTGYEQSRVDTQTDIRPSEAFKSYTQTNLAYRAGLGVEWDISRWLPNSSVLATYRYVNRGVAKTGPSVTYPQLTTGLSNGLASNEVQVAFRFYLG